MPTEGPFPSETKDHRLGKREGRIRKMLRLSFCHFSLFILGYGLKGNEGGEIRLGRTCERSRSLVHCTIPQKEREAPPLRRSEVEPPAFSAGVCRSFMCLLCSYPNQHRLASIQADFIILISVTSSERVSIRSQVLLGGLDVKRKLFDDPGLIIYKSQTRKSKSAFRRSLKSPSAASAASVLPI